jgi:hypothetical protein
VDEPNSIAPSPLGLTAAEALAAAEESRRIILRAGDGVRVGSVDFQRADDPLRHEADQEAAMVHLVREREGEVEPAGTIVMYRPGRLSDTSRSRMLAALAARRPEDHSADVRALSDTIAALKAELIEQPPASWTDHQILLETLAGTAALLGYRHARQEADRNMKPLAVGELRRRDQVQEAASKAGKSNRDPARWEFGERYFAENRNATAYAAAQAFIATAGGKAEDQKSIERTMGTIKKQIAEGRL